VLRQLPWILRRFLAAILRVFADDVNTFNGVFSLLKNNKKINNLFNRISNWRDIISQPICNACMDGGNSHSLYGSDEIIFTQVLRNSPDVKFKYPPYYPLLSHDRLEQHVPKPNLEIQSDGSLWELFKDTKSLDWEHARPIMGKEIISFHFSSTKKWPI
jgi:hypothetical protein